ncbi:hypothetical protein JYU34_004000, partial [Plutella xylostella]
ATNPLTCHKYVTRRPGILGGGIVRVRRVTLNCQILGHECGPRPPLALDLSGYSGYSG